MHPLAIGVVHWLIPRIEKATVRTAAPA
jgi:hypothetical protein